MSPKDYHCPVCGVNEAPQIVRSFPPKMMKCPKCGFVVEEQRFIRAPKAPQNSPN